MGLEEAAEYALSEKEPANSPAPTTEQRPTTGEKQANLTRREREVAALVTRGLTNRQIASDLSISEHTAATHVRKILKKLGFHSRSQITAWVTERRLRPPDSD